MTGVSRRELIVAAVVAAAAGSVPGFGVAETSGPSATWDLSDLYANEAAWESERKALLGSIVRLKSLKGTLARDPASMRAALEMQSDARKRVARLVVYASLKADEDRRVGINQERKQRAEDALSAVNEASAWTGPEVVAMGATKVNTFIAADPVLKRRFAFDLREALRVGAHTITPEGEALLASAEPLMASPRQIRDQLASSDIPRPRVRLSDGTQVRLDDQGFTMARSSVNREDRKLVFDQFWGSYKAFENSLGAALRAQITGTLFEARARHYESALQASLDRENIPEGVYRSLISETNRGLPVLHRYFELRRRILDLPDLGYWDIYPPLVKSDRSYSLAEMRQLTIDAVRPLGPDYVRLLAQSTAKPWMDPLPRPGKATGGYTNGDAYDVHPYLLLNLGNKYDSLTTYAHEWGHAMHALLAKASQPFELVNYSFTGEVASTTHELLLANMMVERAKSKDDKLFYLGQLMENYRSIFFRQAMFAEFQAAINDLAAKGEGLSGEKLSALYLDLLKRYHGSGVQIEPSYGSEWAYIFHFYQGFYVYQYSTSIAAANFFAQSVIHGTPADADRYLSVLRAGGSDYGYNVLKAGGIDMASSRPYELLVSSFSKVLDQAQALLA